MKICFTTAIYTHTGGLIRLYIVIWSVVSQFKWLILFLHHAWRGRGARLSIRTKDPNNHSDTETGTLSRGVHPAAWAGATAHSLETVMKVLKDFARPDFGAKNLTKKRVNYGHFHSS